MRKEALGEVLADELKVIREYVSEIPHMSKKLDKVSNDVDELKTDMKAVKAVVKTHSKEIAALNAAVFK